MKAVVKSAPGAGNVEVLDIDEPYTPPGHVKIGVRAAGICGTDIHIFHDEYRSWPPVVLGHEVAGQVVEVGAGVDSVLVGRRVTTETYVSTCGDCRYCRSGRVNLCLERRSIGSAVDGGFTNFVVVPAGNIHELPENVSFIAGALTEPLACVVHGTIETTEIAPGNLAIVAGPGTIGLLTLQVVRAAGADVIVLGTNQDEQRLQMARELSATSIFNVQRDQFREAILELTGGTGADLVFECSGAGPAAQMLLELTRRGGQYAQIGLFGKPIPWDLDQVCFRELKVSGSNASVPSAWKKALELMAEGTVQTEPLVTSIFPVTAWQEAFDTFQARSGIKTVLQPVEENSA